MTLFQIRQEQPLNTKSKQQPRVLPVRAPQYRGPRLRAVAGARLPQTDVRQDSVAAGCCTARAL